jgi:hypothetical protein
LRNNEFHSTDTEAITNPNVILHQSFRGEVLAECAPGQLHVRQFTTPEVIVLDWVNVNRFRGAAMNGQIRLLITLEIVARDVHAV